MTDIHVDMRDGALHIRSPYNALYVAGARRLGGTWSPERRIWRFDATDETAVRRLLRRHYGTDGTCAPDTVSVRLTGCASVTLGPITYAGRILARAYDRDGGARLGAGVAILAGDVGSGGSRRYWTTDTCGRDATFLLHDVPRRIAERRGRGSRWAVEILDLEPHEGAEPAAAIGEHGSALSNALVSIGRSVVPPAHQAEARW